MWAIIVATAAPIVGLLLGLVVLLLLLWARS
jgi:hypothetical protein